VSEKEFKKFKEVYKEYLKDQELIVEIGIGANPGLYNRIRKNGFKKEYVGVNFPSDTMPIKPEGLDYQCLDALDVEKMNKLIGERETTIISNASLFQIIQGRVRAKLEKELLGKRRKEIIEKIMGEAIKETADAFDKANTDRYLHFQPTCSVEIIFTRDEYGRFYEKFKKSMEERNWKPTDLRIKEFYLQN